MALDTLVGRTPTTIKSVKVELYSTLEIVGDPPEEQDVRSAFYTVVPADQDGQDMNPVFGDAIPHLTPEQITTLQTFMDSWRALAEAALPTP